MHDRRIAHDHGERSPNGGGGMIDDNPVNAPDTADPTTLLGGGGIVIHKD